MFSKKRVLHFKSYFCFLPRLFPFADSKFFLFHFNAHKSKYINEGVKDKPDFSSSKHNFLTTPFPSCLFTIIHLFRSSSTCYLNLVPRVLPYPPLRSKREQETLAGSAHESLDKINPEREVLCISIFCLFFFLSPYYWFKLPFSTFAMITRATLQSLHYSYSSAQTMGKKQSCLV